MPPSDLLRKLIEEHPELLKRGGAFKRSDVHESAEWLRIASLPWRDIDQTLQTTPDLTPLFAAPEGTMKLWPLQSQALLDAERYQGLFVVVPVGGGKTLIAALMAEALKSKCTAVLVPAQLKRRTLEKTYPQLSKHFRLPLDRIHLVSYSELERAPGDVLQRLRPDAVVVDEADYLKHKTAARTFRVFDYLKDESVRLVAMTATPSRKSIMEMAHIINRALREYSPLPRTYMVLQEWAEALDVSDNQRPPGAINRLCERKEHAHDDPRAVFGCRFRGSPGVLSVVAGFEGQPLTLRGRPVTPPPRVVACLERLRKSWVLEAPPEVPEGSTEEIVDDLSYARAIRQLALGFYLRWDWPDGRRDTQWISARQRWNGTVRHVLRYCRAPGLDSPLLVANAASRGGLAKEHQEAWAEWVAVKDRKQPPTVTVWIDRYIVDHCVEWAAEHRGIIWTEHAALNEAINAALGQKPVANAADIVMDGRPQVFPVRKFATGIDDLQLTYNRMLYTTVPNAQKLEQSLGRLHRERQTREVTAEILLPVPESIDHLKAVRKEALYAQGTKFGCPKLLTCNVENLDLGE